jgi:hypothetical protein
MQIKTERRTKHFAGCYELSPRADPCATGRINRVKDKQAPSYAVVGVTSPSSLIEPWSGHG